MAFRVVSKSGGPVEFRTMREKGKPAEGRPDQPNPKWWTLDEAKMPGSIKATIDHIKRYQTSLEMQRQVCARLYGGMIPGSFYGVTYDRLHIVHPSLTGRLTYNLIAIVVDSLISKITKNRVRPLFLTQGGDYRVQRRAKKLSQFVDGLFYENRVDELMPTVFRDALVLGEGMVHVFVDPATRRLKLERTVPSEVHVDEVDGFYGNPRQMHYCKLVDRDIVLQSWGYDESGKKRPEVYAAIERCKGPSKDEAGGTYQYVSDSIGVDESWHLPSSEDAGDGLHVISIDTAVLLSEPYKKQRFPIIQFKWKPRVYGWHGGGLAEELIGTQVEVNHLLYLLQRAFRMMAAFKIVVETGTVPDQHFQDKIGTILHVPHGAMAPQYLAPEPVSQQYFQHFDALKARGFEIARLSQLSAVGVKPAGLNSGESQRVYHDIESEGFQFVGHAFEQFHLDVAEFAIGLVRDLFESERGGDKKFDYEVKAPVDSSSLPGRRFLRTVGWSDVDLADDAYILKAYPVSSLPQTPAGRLATVDDLARAGYIDQRTALKLMDFPDLQAVETLLGAAEDWIMRVLDDVIEGRGYQPPDPKMNLAMAHDLSLMEYSLGAANAMEPKKLEKLDTWIAQVEYLMARAAQAQAQPPVVGMPQPGAPASPLAAQVAGAGPFQSPGGGGGVIPALAAA